MDVTRAIEIETADDFDRWLEANGTTERDVLASILKKSTGRQRVDLVALQEVALCHGWVDTQTKRIDDERYAIRFVPRRQGSNWSPFNRGLARKLLLEGKVRPEGQAVLPPDL